MQEWSTNDFASLKIWPRTISYGSKIPVYELEMESGSTRVIRALLDSPVCGNDAPSLPYLGHARIKEGHTPGLPRHTTEA